jgi:hypothetical protein
MVALVERMLELHKKLAAATIPTDKQLYQSRWRILSEKEGGQWFQTN